jgi:prepilin-type processing-associated H-X9-DG protein
LDSNWVDGWPRNDNVLPANYNYDQGDRGGGDSMVSTMIGRFIIGRHGPKTNVIFMDGQVKTIPHADLWSLAWHKGSQPNFNPAVPKPYPANR